MGGWIKLYREIIDKPIWVNATLEQRVILITLLCMASHRPRKWEFGGEVYEVQPGQFVTSLPSILEKCKSNEITAQKLRTALARFEKLGFLTCKSTNKNRLITIVNWRHYQDYENEDNRQNNRQITGKQQADNRQITSIKNVKNNKNDKNVRKRESTAVRRTAPAGGAERNNKKPAAGEIKDYCESRGNKIDAETFRAYYDAKGWPMDWKAAVRLWEKRDYEGRNPKKAAESRPEERTYAPGELERIFEEKARRYHEGL